MRRALRYLAPATLALVAAVIAGSSAASLRVPATRGIQTSVYLSSESLKPANLSLSLRRVHEAGSKAIRFSINWRAIAPTRRPAGFEASNPSDPSYNWSTPDRVIEAARAHGLTPLVTLTQAPAWAGGTTASPSQFGLFARAAARRYSGSYQGLPRVQTWLIWNEPNLARYISPQYSHHRLVGADRYRKMLNQAAAAIHSVHRDNVVVGGELAPLDTPNGAGAMKFSRSVLCVSKRLRSTCRTKLEFDAWSVHPYTSGGPSHGAYGANGVAFGDLPRLRKVVRAADHLGHVRSQHAPHVWVTEFSWDSRPPDSLGVPADLEAHWTAEALYRAWKAEIPILTWFQLVDEPTRTSPFQSGLYYRGSTYATARPKPALRAFRFPFVAFLRGKKVYVWGRTPDSARHTVAIERRKDSWKRTVMLRANGNGIFFRTIRLHGVKKSWQLRARLAGTRSHSLGFSLKGYPDHYYMAFGG